MLRFEAITLNTKELGCGRVVDGSPTIVAKFASMVNRFCTMLDCVDVGFLPDGILDQLPMPSKIGATKVGGVDLAAKVHSIAGDDTYTVRQAAYDLKKLRSKALVFKPDRTRRYHVPPLSARTHRRLPALRDHVIPILAGVRSPYKGTEPAHQTVVDRDYENLRPCMQTLFGHLGINTLSHSA